MTLAGNRSQRVESYVTGSRAAFDLILENSDLYRMWRLGFDSPDEMSEEDHERVMQGLLENPLVAEWWNRRMTPFSDEFYEYIEQLRNSPGSSWTHQQVGSRAESAA